MITLPESVVRELRTVVIGGSLGTQRERLLGALDAALDQPASRGDGGE